MKKNKSLSVAFLLLLFTALALSTMCSSGGVAEADRPVKNLRALAKLYGYLRYFNPSDEAARVDWDALAVLAAEKVKSAPNPAALKAALEEMFRPVAPAMTLYFKGENAPVPVRAEISAEAASRFVSWQHMGLGTGAQNSAYRSIRLNRPSEMSGQATLAHTLDIAKHGGKTVKMSAWVKALPGDMNSQAQLWLRVDGPAGPSFFDNMRDRPIRNSEWSEYTISGPIAAGAQKIVFGALVFSKGKFLVDGFRLSVKDAAGREEPLTLENGGFEEGDAGAALHAVRGPAVVAEAGDAGKRRLQHRDRFVRHRVTPSRAMLRAKGKPWALRHSSSLRRTVATSTP